MFRQLFWPFHNRRIAPGRSASLRCSRMHLTAVILVSLNERRDPNHGKQENQNKPSSPLAVNHVRHTLIACGDLVMHVSVSGPRLPGADVPAPHLHGRSVSAEILQIVGHGDLPGRTSLAQDLGFVEGASLHDAFAFADCDKLTGGEPPVLLDEPEGPMNFNIG